MVWGMKVSSVFGVRLRNPERVKLPLSNVSWRACANRLAKVHQLPPSNYP